MKKYNLQFNSYGNLIDIVSVLKCVYKEQNEFNKDVLFRNGVKYDVLDDYGLAIDVESLKKAGIDMEDLNRIKNAAHSVLGIEEVISPQP